MSEALLWVDGVGKSFRRTRSDGWLLKEVSLRMQAGDTVAVVATRGQGKSTLLRIVAGIELVDEGRVLFEGRDLASLSEREHARLLRERIGLAARSGPGMRLSMLDYVGLPLLVNRRRADRRGLVRIARGALERVGVGGCAERCWDELSDWERALAEIAQGIVAAPRLLLVDDVMDGLGIRETEEIGRLLRSLVEESGMGVLMCASDGDAALCCDRVYALRRGALGLISDQSSASSARRNVIDFPASGSAAGDARG
jgi:putative ABC transport system ATP-binding protein